MTPYYLVLPRNNVQSHSGVVTSKNSYSEAFESLFGSYN